MMTENCKRKIKSFGRDGKWNSDDVGYINKVLVQSKPANFHCGSSKL